MNKKRICALIGFLFLILRSASALEVNIEKSTSGLPFTGIAADGTSTLELEISVPDKNGKILINNPTFGLLKTSEGRINASQKLSPDSDGKIKLIYQPPAYLSDDQLTSTNCATPSWKAQECLSFEYIPTVGHSLNFSKKFDLVRPPALMVHGFTGGRQSLASLSAWLQSQKFDTLLEEYYNKETSDRFDSSIEAQAAKLAKHIKTVLNTYNQSGIKIAKVDIVSHSMGGLVSRTYLRQWSEDYEPRVRKLIMIATPNHGVPWIEKIVGNVLAQFLAKYHQEAANQLFCGNPIFRFLNKGERWGKHVNGLVQYAVIAGVRHRYPYWDVMGNVLGDLSAAAEDDGVVTKDSARMNGVQFFLLGQMAHTYAPELQRMFPQDEPMPRASRTAVLVKKLLLRNIPFLPLKSSEMTIKRGEGEVYFKKSSFEEWQSIASYPVDIECSFGMVKTASGSALLNFAIRGSHWSSIMVPPETEIQIAYASPELVRVFVKKGEARFVSIKKDQGRFEIVLGQEGNDWMQFAPRARIGNIDSDFIVSNKDGCKVFSLEGKLSFQSIAEDGSKKNFLIPSGKGLETTLNGKIKEINTFSEISAFENDLFRDQKHDQEKSDIPEELASQGSTVFEASEISLVEAEVEKNLSSDWATNNKGAKPHVAIMLNPQDSPSTQTKIFIRFDHSTFLNKTSSIAKTVLELSPLSNSEGEGSVDIFPVLTPWNDDIIWNTQPMIATLSLNRFSLPKKGDLNPFQIDITPLLQKWIEGQIPNYGFVIVPVREEGNSFVRFFCSTNYSNLEKNPKIRVFWDRADSKKKIDESMKSDIQYTLYGELLTAKKAYYDAVNSSAPTKETFSKYQTYKKIYDQFYNKKQ
ncbi:MAG: DNRLRE domain-containing protein [Candidatus Riflebacteria bacterium]|nr:DNRLRE domain-containing protein [Candidatus Riflebacteria bacterium]